MTLIVERLSSAVHSSDLSHKETLCDADYLQGLGLATRRNRLGSALIDLDLKYTPSVAVTALNAVMEVVRTLAKKHRWAMTPVKCRRIAMAALNAYLRPLCPCCNGRGVVGVDTDKPSEYRPRSCTACSGSGLEDLPEKNRHEVREVLYVMQCERGRVDGRFRRVMRK